MSEISYTPTVWVNNAAPALSATNLNKLTDELETQAAAASISHTLPTWANGAAPALTDATPWNEIERVVDALSDAKGSSYTPIVWQDGWIPARNAVRLNRIEQQVAVLSDLPISDPGYSASRYVYYFGDPAYNGTGWSGNTTSRGWERAAENKANDQHQDYESSVTVMQSADANCHTMRCSLFPGDPIDGPSANYLHSHVGLPPNGDIDDYLAAHGGQAALGAKQGQEHWYGFAFRTSNPFPLSTSGSGNWNMVWSFHNYYRGSSDVGASIQLEIATKAPSGATPGTQYLWNSSLVTIPSGPHFAIELNAGNGSNTSGAGDAGGTPAVPPTCRRYLCCPFTAGTLYKVALRVKWDAFGAGQLEVWINGTRYVNATSGISTMIQINGTPDPRVYPVFEHYVQNVSHLAAFPGGSHIYYGGLLRGIHRTDVTVP